MEEDIVGLTKKQQKKKTIQRVMIERARHKPTACLSYVHNQYMYSKLYDLMV